MRTIIESRRRAGLREKHPKPGRLAARGPPVPQSLLAAERETAEPSRATRRGAKAGTSRANSVLSSAVASRPGPQAMPIAAVIHRPVAAVKPCILKSRCHCLQAN
jgi:hypothetical protein